MIMLRSIRRCARIAGGIAQDSSGVSVLETAILAPTLLILLAGSCDLAMAFSVKLKTQQAAARAVEYATNTELDSVAASDLQTQAATAAGVPTNAVTVQRWLECNGVAQSSYDGSCNSGEEVARYVSVKVANSYKPIMGALLPTNARLRSLISFTGYSSVRLQ